MSFNTWIRTRFQYMYDNYGVLFFLIIPLLVVFELNHVTLSQPPSMLYYILLKQILFFI